MISDEKIRIKLWISCRGKILINIKLNCLIDSSLPELWVNLFLGLAIDIVIVAVLKAFTRYKAFQENCGLDITDLFLPSHFAAWSFNFIILQPVPYPAANTCRYFTRMWTKYKCAVAIVCPFSSPECLNVCYFFRKSASPVSHLHSVGAADLPTTWTTSSCQPQRLTNLAFPQDMPQGNYRKTLPTPLIPVCLSFQSIYLYVQDFEARLGL